MTDQDVVDLLTAQHAQITTLLARLKAGEDGKQDLFTDLVRLLAVHESAEEQVVHPVAGRARFGADDDIVRPRLEEENAAKRALAHLYDLGVDHPDFDAALAAFADAVAEHATREETEEFTLLRAQFSTDQLRRMAGSVRAAEAVAPTRPHPGTGESAAANLLAGPPLALFDRARDAVRDWRRNQDM
ncbi:hemerythrin domain-containing protein [Streptomyces gardneri]|uniref:hemerythrin domain-containing protein n=1 Tax=Nocardia sputi TaxID=2943705 RepID=UPI001892EC11|nr:hemerythrin domain-containing protein [Nocardia sputi]MBF6166824.1 hemerythrin domain-containing protein [Streptomyces gardneri]MBF6206655.1 hemerythrin domain-containing protein [Streptomyces gardneri]